MWCIEYAPTLLSEFNTNKDNIDSIKKWIETLKTVKKCKPLLIIGPVGSGKTLLARLVLEKYNYDIHEFNSGDVRSQKNIKLNLENIMNCRPLFNNKEFGIIIDELESINSDRGGISQLQTMINPKNNVNRTPIICICAENEDKKFVDLKRNCEIILLKRPNRFECRKIIDKMCLKTGHELDDDIIDNIIKESEYDIRKCINYVQDICNTKKIKSDLYGKKDIILNNYDTVYKILHDDDVDLDIIKSDPMIIPMILHENYINHINSNYKDNIKKKLVCLKQISDMYSYTNIIDKYIIANNTWELTHYSKIIKQLCVRSVLHAHLKDKNTFNNNTLKFTRLLTNSSNGCNNYKFKIKISEKLFVNTYNINIIEDFISKLIDNNKTEYLKEYIDKYNIDNAELLKIYKNINLKETQKDIIKYIKDLFD
jgi:DNA polymerase III delta prime subunit